MQRARTLIAKHQLTTSKLLWIVALVLLIAYVAARWHGVDTGRGLSITD